MPDKKPQHPAGKTPAKSLKEKRTDKRSDKRDKQRADRAQSR